MTDTDRGGFEDRLRAALTARAGSLSAPPDGPGMTDVVARAGLRHSRRRWEAVTLAVVVVMAVGLSVAVTSGGPGPRQTAGPHHLDRTTASSSSPCREPSAPRSR